MQRKGRRPPTSTLCFKTLGLQVRLGAVCKGFFIGHTDERREELRTALEDVLRRRQVEPKQAERLKGRMQWFEGYAFGRIAQYSLKVIGEVALKKQSLVTLDARELNAIEFLLRRVSEAEAVKINSVTLDTFYVFLMVRVKEKNNVWEV